MWKRSRNRTRCDWEQVSESPSVSAEENSSDDCESVPLIAAAIRPLERVTRTPLHELARREPYNVGQAFLERCGYCIESVDHGVTDARNFVHLQDKWNEMLCTVKNAYSPEFWKFFLQFHRFSGVVIDRALGSVKKMFLPAILKKNFPSCRRKMRQELRVIEDFWKLVSHTHRIDVSQFGLESGTQYVEFHFIDPIWGWLLAAQKQAPASMHWKAAAQNHQHATYGGGIQYGECFKTAYESCDDNSSLMLMTIHFDGTYGRSLDITPMAIGVANCNSCDLSKEFCISYIPVTPDQRSSEFKKTTKSTKYVCSL